MDTPRSGFLNVLNLLARAGEASCQLAVALMTGLVLVQVVLRYIFRSPLVWAEEASIFLMIWMAFVGAGVAVRQKSHIAMTFLQDRLLASILRPLAGFSNLAILVFLAIVTWQGWLLVISVEGQRSPALGIPMAWPYIVIPIGAVFTASQVVAGMLGPASPQASGMEQF